MIADALFVMGSTHKVCQDYSLAKTFPMGELSGCPEALVVLSDGCSSSEDTDFGSRVLSLAVTNVFSTGNWDNPLRQALKDMADVQVTLGMDTECMDATLLYAFPVPETNIIRVIIHGDGVVAARTKSGVLEHFVVESPRNAPDYPYYMMDEDRRWTYEKLITEPKILEGFSNGVSFLRQEHKVFRPVVLEIPKDRYDLVVLMSDGACSFIKSGSMVRVPVWDVVQQVCSVQNPTPGFMERRVRNGFLKKFCPIEGWIHQDDFSVAALAW